MISPGNRISNPDHARGVQSELLHSLALDAQDDLLGIDLCENCREPLKDTTRALLRLTSVRTVRRDRISSDEEERRRAGFELQTAYRFAEHGGRPGWIDATATGASGPLIAIRYGDSRTPDIGRKFM